MKFHKSNLIKVLIFVVLVVLYFFISIKDLYVDVINPDGINWHTRTQAFTEALVHGKYNATFQAYHPGTTLMWVSGPLLNLFKGNNNEDSGTLDPKVTFLTRDYFAKMSVIVFSTILYILSLTVLWKLVGFKYSLFYSVLFTMEPFCIGMRRLYHLDFLMTALIFLSFLLIIYFNYKSPRWFLVIFSGLLYSLALLTKSAAIAILPVMPFIFLLGNAALLKKFLAILLFGVSIVFFVYAFFPPIWQNPRYSIPKYYRQIAFGVTDIGIEGRKEVGTSGRSDNIILDDTIDSRSQNFYIVSLFFRLSIAGGFLLVVSVGVFIYFFIKGFIQLIWNAVKNKRIPKIYIFSPESWLCFWSIGISIAVLIALSIPVKKTDRYEILVFPFLFTVIAFFFNKLKLYISIPLSILYIYFVLSELIPLHPYYISYSNPLFGGIEMRLRAVDGSPFGVGTYAAFDVVKKDMLANGYSGYYTISGSKSIKEISVGGKFSRFPSCLTDYTITYTFETSPINECAQEYILLNKVKISGFDYWYIYKRLNQKHENNYD